jgi:hypothetical protein
VFHEELGHGQRERHIVGFFEPERNHWNGIDTAVNETKTTHALTVLA